MGRFDHLGHGLAVHHEAGVVAHHIYVRVLGGPHALVAVDAVALAHGQGQGAGEAGALDTAGPDKGVGLDDLAGLEQHLARFGSDDSLSEHDLATFFGQVLLGLGAQWFFQNGKNGGQGFDVGDLDVLRIHVILAAHDIAKLQQFADHLDAGEAGAGHDKVEHALARHRIEFLGSGVENMFHMVADFHGVFEGPEGEAVFLDSGNAEELGLRAYADNAEIEVVIGDGARGFFRLEIDSLDSVLNDIDSLRGEYLAETNLNRLRLRPPSGHLMQFRHKGVEGLGIHQGYFYVRVFPEMLFQDLARPDSAVTAADYEDLFCFAHKRNSRLKMYIR